MSKNKIQIVMSINPWFIVGVALLLILTGRFIAQSTTAAASRYFNMPTFGATSFLSTGTADLTKGYVRVQAVPQNGPGPLPIGQPELPAGLAIFGNTQNGVLTSEAAVPIQPLISAGRVYAEIAGPVMTGIAIANPNTQPVTINFFFTDASGNDFGQGSTTINAGNQVSTLLTSAPFNAPTNTQATFSFTSSLLVSAIALRVFINERNETLMTTLPVTVISTATDTRYQIIPQFVDGGGWSTRIVLTNPTDGTISGTVSALGSDGNPATITLNGVAAQTFNYSIPPRSFFKLQSSGTASTPQVVFIGVLPTIHISTPGTAFSLFSFKSNGVTTTAASVPATLQWDTTFNMFVESAGDWAAGVPGSVDSGIAIACYGASFSKMGVMFQLYGSDGTLKTAFQKTLQNAPWQTALMLSEIPGVPPPPFQGVLRVSLLGGTPSGSAIPGAVIGIRARYNERRELILTTASPVPEHFFTTSSELLFPHFVVGSNYQTQFILFAGNFYPSAGTMYFFDQSGNPLSLPMQ